MDRIELILGLALIAIGIQWYTWTVCIRFGRWVFPTVLAVDFLMALGRLPIPLVVWKLCFFVALARWEPVRGLFRLPRWPQTHQRGRGGRRPREFTEPPPWVRGPGTY